MNNLLSEEDLTIIRAILIEKFEVVPEQIVPDARIIEDLGLDSLGVVELGLALEDRFNLIIPDESWEAISTVGDLCEALAQWRKRSSGPA